MESLQTVSSQNNEKFPNNLPPHWRALLGEEAEKPYFKALTRFLNSEYQDGKEIFPAPQNILRAIKTVDLDQVKAVILGQDPYHGEGQAIGYSFAVPNELFPKPPSLTNIFKELSSDLNIEVSKQNSDLSGWVSQGVLLLNSVLTVRKNQAFSHRNQGWEIFTDTVIRHLNQRPEPIVFILWGAAAQAKKSIIDNPIHAIIESPHPSPLSSHRGFFGSKPFSKTNEYLVQWGKSPVNWSQGL